MASLKQEEEALRVFSELRLQVLIPGADCVVSRSETVKESSRPGWWRLT